jgi:tetratricopeptide (TPR) repeat protein
VLERFGQAAMDAGRAAEAAAALEEAIAAFHDRGDPRAEARAMFPLVQVMLELGDPRTFEMGDQALAILEPLSPGPELVGALIEVARASALGAESVEGVRFAERALALAADLGLPTPARALGYRGLARCELGDPAGIADMRKALQIALDAGQGREAGLLYNNLSRVLLAFEGPVAALEMSRMGIAFDEARGLTGLALWMRGGMLDILADAGELEEVLTSAERVAEEASAAGILPPALTVRATQARVFAMRGDADRAMGFLDWLERSTRETGGAEILIMSLGSSAIARAAHGQDDRARTLLDEIAATPDLRSKSVFFTWLPFLVRAALSIGDSDLAGRLATGPEPTTPYAEHALVAVSAALAEAGGDFRAGADAYADAAERWKGFGVVPEQAYALLGRGRCLLELFRPDEASDTLRSAREIFIRCGMRPALQESDALLSKATALSS